jgi:hypothetical protein
MTPATVGVMTPLPSGTKVRAVRDSIEVSAGMEFEIEEYISGAEAEDGRAFYWGSRNGGINNVVALADDIEVVMSSEAMRNRALPSASVIASEIGSALCGLDGDGFTIDGTEVEPDGSVNLYGETQDGLRFGCTVAVLRVMQTDY